MTPEQPVRIVLDEADKATSTGRKILAFIKAELVRLRAKNDGSMPDDHRTPLIAKIQIYKELEHLWDAPKGIV